MEQEENIDAYVVVVGPDDRPQDQKLYELDSHECCALHLNKYSVFVMPKGYGIPKADVKAKAQVPAFSEQQAIDSLKGHWGGGPALGIFSLQEAVVVARELLNRSYVMLVKDITDDPPKVGYLMDLMEWRSMHRTLERHAIKRPQYVEGYYDQYLCRALRIQVLGKGKGVRVETRVIDLAEKIDLKPGLCRVGTWQRRLWDVTAGRIADDDVGCVSCHRDQPRKSMDYKQLDAGIDGKDREALYLLLMSAFWSKWKKPIKNIAADYAEQFGRNRPQEPGNMRNVLGRLGCVAPSSSLVPTIYNDLREAAMARTASLALFKRISWVSVLNDHDLALRLLAVRLPDKVGEIVWAAT